MKKLLNKVCHPIGIPKLSLKVKLTTTLFLLVLMQIQASSYSQDTKITLNLNNVTVQSVLDEIESQTEFKFFINTDYLDLSQKVSVNEKEERISTILDKILIRTNIVYKVVGKQIVLKVDPQMINTSKAQSRSNSEEAIPQEIISGTVMDEDNTPLPGASVMLKGTVIGVAADFDGNFNIQASKGDILVVSYIGFNSKELVVSDQTELKVILTTSNKLDEVVVVAYGTKKKVNLSGSVAAVGEEYFESRPIVNVGQALQGAIGNLNITQSASPNSTPSFNVRGTTSLSGGEPMVVIDGITSTQLDLGRINPNDIASISVLKDAASSSIYGSRASFGVILVTTKNAKTDKMKITVNLNNSIKRLGKRPEFIYDPYEVANFKDIMGAPWYDLYSAEDLEYVQQVSAGNAPATRINPARPDRYQYFHQTNWADEVLRKNTNTNNINLNISQNFDGGSFLISGEAIKNEGLYKYNTDIHKRYNLRTKGNYNITDWLKLSNNTWIYSNEYDESNATGSSFFNEIVNRFTLDPLYNPDGSHTYSYARLIGRLEAGNYNTEESTFQTLFAADLKFFNDKLKIHGDASYKRLMRGREVTDGPVTYSEGPGHTAITGPNAPYARFENWREKTDVYNVYTTFADTYGEKHSIELLAGYNQENFSYNTTSGRRNELISAGLPTVELATGEQFVNQSKYEWAVQGVFGRLNYIYDDKYILEGNLRYDGSSRFPSTDRWALNPSFSASWVVSNEKFLKQNSLISLLKFRGSWGTLGNQDVGPYPYIASLGSGITSAILDGTQPTAVYGPGLVSPSLTWETVKTINGGIDLGFMANKLAVSFDYYNRYTLDMLTTGKQLPEVLGTGVPVENAADLVTKGWELALGWKDRLIVGKKDFNYSLNFNLSDSRAYIEKFDNPTGDLDQYYVGREIGEIWGFVTHPNGFYQTQEEIDFGPDISRVSSYPSTRPVLPGDVRFTDLNGDNEISWEEKTLDKHGDLKIIGNSRDRFTFGLDLNANWNNFDLRAFFQGVGKKDYYPSGSSARNYFWSAFAFPWASITEENFYNHWTPENRNAFFPRLKAYVAENAGSSYGAAEVSLTQTRWMQDASYIRMKNITIGYTIPSDTMNKIGVDNLRLYISGENLFEITKLYKYLDPENLEGYGYPFQRTYSLGLSLTF